MQLKTVMSAVDLKADCSTDEDRTVTSAVGLGNSTPIMPSLTLAAQCVLDLGLDHCSSERAMSLCYDLSVDNRQ